MTTHIASEATSEDASYDRLAAKFAAEGQASAKQVRAFEKAQQQSASAISTYANRREVILRAIELGEKATTPKSKQSVADAIAKGEAAVEKINELLEKAVNNRIQVTDKLAAASEKYLHATVKGHYYNKMAARDAADQHVYLVSTSNVHEKGLFGRRSCESHAQAVVVQTPSLKN